MKNLLSPFVIEGIQRVLGLQDRNPFSGTYGCFDREFWQYKTVKEFPSATYQSAMLSLAMVYLNDFEGNMYFRSTKIAEWAKAGIQYWARIQHRDGSFDEWFLNEHSYCATAFTTMSAAQTFLLLYDHFENQSRKEIKGALFRAGEWLSRHHNPLVANQNMAALNALMLLNNIFGETRFEPALLDKKKVVLESQCSEGWFIEYQGADIGYGFLAIDLLAFYVEKKGDHEIKSALKRLIAFLKWFVHPDGTAGGFYGSRGSQYILLWGLVHRATKAKDKDCAEILGKITQGLIKETTVTPNTIDDNYFSYFYINSWVGACITLKDIAFPNIENRQEAFTKVFREARLCVLQNSNYYAITSLAKNGVLLLFNEERVLYSDAGYAGIVGRNTQIVSHVAQNSNLAEISCESVDAVTTIKTIGKFSLNKATLPLVRHVVLFKVACRTVFQWDVIAQNFVKLVKRKNVVKHNDVGLVLKRRIRFEPHRIKIIDEIESKSRLVLREIRSINESVIQESPASRIFVVHGLSEFPAFDSRKAVDILRQKKIIRISTTIFFDRCETRIEKEIV